MGEFTRLGNQIFAAAEDARDHVRSLLDTLLEGSENPDRILEALSDFVAVAARLRLLYNHEWKLLDERALREMYEQESEDH
jgi:hypothetical protein